jgi:rhodanese-related sulfurtransferase/peroxiredoxin
MRPEDSPHKRKLLGRLLNISIIVMLFVLAAILLKKHSQDDSISPTIGPSARIFIKDLDWAKSEQTLLLALQEDCQYCTESARFYREIIQGLSGRNDVRVVAIFPESVFDAENYLSQLGLSINERKETSLLSLGVKEVPTLVLVNKNGVVSNVWIGQLPPKKEAEVITALQLKNTRPVSEWTLNEKELAQRVGKHEAIVIVDLRERMAYTQNHRDGSKNIPLDELDARAMNELSRTDTIVLDGDDDLMTDAAYTTLSRQGFSSVFILRRDAPTQ